MSRIFGTDGIRGCSNQYPMTADIALKIGMAAALHLGDISGKTNRVVIGKDTRLSCYMFETALTAGLNAMGKDVMLLGPMPTPAVAMLTRAVRADLGIMISASHNPYFDNGIKLFGYDGYKMTDKDERAIEALITTDLSKYYVAPEKVGRVERLKESSGRYIEYVKSVFPPTYSLSGLKIVVDCANGASYKVAPAVFYELGAEVIEIATRPNGLNINDNCGSTYIENVRRKILELGADIGIAFDGDADRVIMVDEKGNVIDGDKILAIIATKLQKKNSLAFNTVVGTVMANFGFEEYLNKIGVKLLRTNVGDRYVGEELKRGGFSLGGEQSGHILLPNYNTTGDGLLASLEALGVIVESGKPASYFYSLYEDKPQIMRNILFSDKNPIQNESILNYIEKISLLGKGRYRVLVRKSGTEKLIRVMVEGEDENEITNVVDDLVNAISKVAKA